MILYCVSVSVQADIAPEWRQWMQAAHIPDVMKTGCFSSHQLFRCLEPEDPGYLSYVIQYRCESMTAYQRYQAEFGPGIRQKHADRYAGKFKASRILLESAD